MNKLQMECEMFCPLYLQDEEAYDFDNYLKSVLENFKCDVYITTRIDNDDAISVKMVERIQNFYEKIRMIMYFYHLAMDCSIQRKIRN